jgi:hypothetical protein
MLLPSPLTTHNLSHTVNFENKNSKALKTAIDNIFLDNGGLNPYFTSHTVNRLSDHYAQFLIINNIYAATNTPLKHITKKFNKNS